MNYYIKDKTKIVLFDTDKERLLDTLIMLPDYMGLPIEETTREIISLKGELVFKDEVNDELAIEREQLFKKEFFEIADYGWFRKTPKGYASAVEAMGAAFNMVSIIGTLPADTLTFYKAPDFLYEEQCSEEWLVTNSFKNEELTAQEFGVLYAKFLEGWNKLEHK